MWTMTVPEPHAQHMTDMRKWMRINKCFEESEAAFLESDLSDLINVGGAADRGLGKLVPFAKRVVMAAYKRMTSTKKVSSSKYKTVRYTY